MYIILTFYQLLIFDVTTAAISKLPLACFLKQGLTYMYVHVQSAVKPFLMDTLSKANSSESPNILFPCTCIYCKKYLY